MAKAAIEPFNRIINVLTPHLLTENARRALMARAFGVGHPLLRMIDTQGAAHDFSIRLVMVLHDYGELEPGVPALVRVLETVREQVGTDKQAEIDDLIAQVRALRTSTPPAPHTPPPIRKAPLPPPPFVFISYSRQDAAFRDRLIADLGALGIRSWIDTSDLTPGTPDWEAAIRAAIGGCAAVILIASPESQMSRFVRDELAIADDSGKRIFPVWARGDKWSASIPLGRGTIQYIDLREAAYTPQNVARLAVALRKEWTPPPIQPETKPNRATLRPAIDPRTPPAPPPKRGGLQTAGVIIALATLLVGIIGVTPVIQAWLATPTPNITFTAAPTNTPPLPVTDKPATSSASTDATFIPTLTAQPTRTYTPPIPVSDTPAPTNTPTPPNTPPPAAGQLRFTIFRDADSFTFHLPAGAPNDLTEIAFSAGGSTYTLDQYSAFVGLPFAALPTPICLRLVRASADNVPVPLACTGTDVLLLTQQLVDADIFWYDNGDRTILTQRSGVIITFCGAGLARCDFALSSSTSADDDDG